MLTLVADCPRCGVKKHTFDVNGVIYTIDEDKKTLVAETFCSCRACRKGTIFVVSDHSSNMLVQNNQVAVYRGNLNRECTIDGFISIVDFYTIAAPKHLPEPVRKAFSEAARAYSVECWNAAACMLRASIDIATKGLLPKENVDGLSDNIRRSLARRLKWLFQSNKLQKDLEGLAACVKDDGNDAAHSTTLGKEDAVDLLEFTVALLERIYTEPQKVRLAEQRRKERRAMADGARKEQC